MLNSIMLFKNMNGDMICIHICIIYGMIGALFCLIMANYAILLNTVCDSLQRKKIREIMASFKDKIIEELKK